MNISPISKRTLMAGAAVPALVLLGAGLAAPAHAQANAPVDCPDTDDDGVCDDDSQLSTASLGDPESGGIVVTGSRIRRDEYSAVEPITVITSEEITQSGFASATDALQSAAVTAGAAQINNYYGGFVTAGGTGANTLGLRNLGPERTLILLNGRRLAPAGTRGSVLAADLNVLPTAVVERIEVLKAGASSVYGSDAVAGVVNIITDRMFDGLQIEGQINVPENGSGIERRISGTFGVDADRLNIVGSLEYRKRDALAFNDANFTRCPIEGLLTGEGTAFGSGDYIDPATGQPACFTINNGGVTLNTLGVPTRQAQDRLTGTVGAFNRLVPDATVTGGPTPGYAGVGIYTRDSFDPLSQEEPLITPAEIYTGFLQAGYELGGAGNAELYGEVLATRRKSSSPLYRQLSLDYLQGSPLVPEIFREGAFLAPNETSSGQNVAARAFIGFGLTDSEQNVDYVRAGGGVRGDFLSDWRYDVYVGKSWTDATYEIESFLIDRVAQSLDVVQNEDGSFSCASQASNANCVAAPPLNADTIGGILPQAYRDYIVANTIGTTVFRETTVSASVDGSLFALPGGDVSLALGAEYRKQRIDDTPDENAINGNLLGLTASVPTRGSDSVKEVFGEVFLPLLADRPFFEALNLSASARYTDYESYGSDVTYKVSGEWEFFPGFGIRGSYGTSYRAPALAEQFLGATSGFISGANDPCDADNFPNDPADYSPNDQVAAQNCAAIGLDVASFTQNSSVTVFNRGGAETGLEAETSTNWSVGAVVQPTLPASVGSLSLALDYFDIEVENGVSSLGGATILQRCYSDTAFDPNAGFCRFVSRDASNVLEVTSGFVNLSTDIRRGFEFNGRLASEIAGGRLTFNANVTRYTEQSSRLFPEEFLNDANGTYVTPDWVGAFDASYRSGGFTVRYGVDWIDGSEGTYEYFAFDEQTGEVDEALAQDYRDNYILEVPDYFLHHASVQYNLENVEVTFGVRNLLDEQPPQISAAVTTIGNAPLYSGFDYRGRTFFLNTAFGF